MLLSDYVKKENIISELQGAEKNSIITEMGNLLARSGAVTDKDAFIQAIIVREEIESTAVGEGIAIPHTRGQFCKQLSVSIGRSKNGVDFGALDSKLVYLIFMIAAPEEANKQYLQVIAKIARFLRHPDNKQAMMDADDAARIFDVIVDFDSKFPGVETVKTKDGRVIHKEM